MSTRILLVGKRRPTRKAELLTAISEPTVYKMWDPRRLTNLEAFTACFKDSKIRKKMNELKILNNLHRKDILWSSLKRMKIFGVEN
jgi:hypothetical protein